MTESSSLKICSECNQEFMRTFRCNICEKNFCPPCIEKDKCEDRTLVFDRFVKTDHVWRHRKGNDELFEMTTKVDGKFEYRSKKQYYYKEDDYGYGNGSTQWIRGRLSDFGVLGVWKMNQLTSGIEIIFSPLKYRSDGETSFKDIDPNLEEKEVKKDTNTPTYTSQPQDLKCLFQEPLARPELTPCFQCYAGNGWTQDSRRKIPFVN